MTEENTYLNTHQAAVLLGLSAKTLARYRVAGTGPVFPPLRRPRALSTRRPQGLGGVAAARLDRG